MINALFTTIGNRYADKLGYEEFIGAYGVVVEQMKALCRVSILTAKDLSLIGKEIDVHIGDITPENTASHNEYMVLVDTTYGEILYSQNKELMKYIMTQNVGKKYTRYPVVEDLSEIMDIVSITYPDPEKLFKIFNLDAPQAGYKYSDTVERFHRLEEARRKGNEASVKLDEVMKSLAEKGLVFDADRPKDLGGQVNQSLVDSLRNQLEKMEVLPIIEFDLTKAESAGLDKDEEDFTGFGGLWHV